ncbi:MAG: BamA/TamA family outer membrane protein, partial [Prevotellaceae bacterium]|jgi:outer membrane protein insertion porin family|nr:BamA/TamA family outer membrane protein [Prevotellaceae bacterium]
LNLYEGQRYYIRNIRWIGNTVYSTERLNRVLDFKKGDVYNQRRLDDRLMNDEDAVSSLYMDNGYLFFHIDPIETNIAGDSVDLEMRIFEGKQATIDRIGIEGNERVYEHVIRRELRTKPGELFSKSDVIRTVRELAQMGHFDPETIKPDIKPNPENGTVDINYVLETKGSDQVELSGGYGPTGIIVSGSLKFTNFAIQNLFKPSTYRIVPQGEGQTLMLRAQTNGSYFQSYSVSFLEPWLGGKRPNSLSVSAFYSLQTGLSDRYYDEYLYLDPNQNYLPGSALYDKSKHINILGVSAGLGRRLSWPDDYFTLYTEVAYQLYDLKNWDYFLMKNGQANNLSLKVNFGRNSIDNPIYTRSGSQITLGLQITPPYSLFSDKDYSNPDMSQSERWRWIEYHKWKFKSKMFTPLTSNGNLVLMGRVEYGFLGYFDKNRRSPFETFYVGGDGMSGSGYTYATEAIAMRGYANGSLTALHTDPATGAVSQTANYYSRLGLELRYPLTLSAATTIYALGFVDAGNSWYDIKDFSPFDLKRSAGFGLRIFLPMLGMLGLDWGYGFDKVWVGNEYKKSGGQFTFVIGQEF